MLFLLSFVIVSKNMNHNKGNRNPRTDLQQQNIKKAHQARREQGQKSRELTKTIQELKKEKTKSIDEQIYNLKQQIENIRYNRKPKTEETPLDYRAEYYKILDKYYRLVKIIELFAVIDDNVLADSDEVLDDTPEDFKERMEDHLEVIDELKEKDYLN